MVGLSLLLGLELAISRPANKLVSNAWHWQCVLLAAAQLPSLALTSTYFSCSRSAGLQAPVLEKRLVLVLVLLVRLSGTG